MGIKKSLAKTLCASLLAGFCASFCVSLANASPAFEAKAYTVSSLPTTIDLNATNEASIREYFAKAEGLGGFELLGELKEILSDGQKYYSYDDTSGAIWQIYEISDRDWEKSPASEITQGTYDETSNVITGYSYGSNKSHTDNPYVHALYVDRSVDNPMQAWGNHNQTLNGINREHIWPKSHGFNQEGAGGARGDLMHLWPADGKTNNLHSNYDYGYVDTSKSYYSVTASIPYSVGNYLGTSETLGAGTVFEPQDCDKGDIARACFYMAARYNNVMGDDDGCDTNNPYLMLSNSVNASSSGTSNSSTPYYLGVLDDLLEWNRLDPPDDFEIHRNDLLYTNYTNNRNPFIDFPDWAEAIWGDSGKTASPSTDAIHEFGPDGIKLSEETKTISIDEEASLYAVSSDGSDITWASNDESVCSISDSSSGSGPANAITLVALTPGKTTITASATIGEETYSATCAITVTEKPTTSESSEDDPSSSSPEDSSNADSSNADSSDDAGSSITDSSDDGSSSGDSANEDSDKRLYVIIGIVAIGVTLLGSILGVGLKRKKKKKRKS